jgi:hypothetical protein
MRRLAVLFLAASALSCSNSQNVSEQFAAPTPTPPTMQAPICARPMEKEAIDVSALLSQLQLITMTCHTSLPKPNYAVAAHSPAVLECGPVSRAPRLAWHHQLAAADRARAARRPLFPDAGAFRFRRRRDRRRRWCRR